MNKAVKTAITMVIALAVTAFLFRHDKGFSGSWIAVGLMMGIIFAAMFVPAVGHFIVEKPKMIFWSGVAIAAGGLILPLSWFALSDHVPAAGESDPIGSVMAYAMMVGICLAILPRSIAVQRRAQPALERAKALPARDTGFSGIGEGWRANIETIRRFVPLLRIAGPWIAIVVAAWLAGRYLDLLWPQYSGEFPIRVWTRMLLSISLVIAIPTVLVGWHRYLLEQRVPRFILPDWNVLRFLWRLWMIVVLTSVVTQLAVMNTKDVARLARTEDTGLVFVILFWGCLALAVFLGSQFGLVFPAISLGRRDFAGMDSLAMTKPLGIAFRLGFVFSLLPFAGLGYVVSWALTRMIISRDFLPQSGGDLPVDFFSFIVLGLFSMALVSCATYLSNVYASQTVAAAAVVDGRES